jgi:hypothetical protein
VAQAFKLIPQFAGLRLIGPHPDGTKQRW